MSPPGEGSSLDSKKEVSVSPLGPGLGPPSTTSSSEAVAIDSKKQGDWNRELQYHWEFLIFWRLWAWLVKENYESTAVWTAQQNVVKQKRSTKKRKTQRDQGINTQKMHPSAASCGRYQRTISFWIDPDIDAGSTNHMPQNVPGVYVRNCIPRSTNATPKTEPPAAGYCTYWYLKTPRPSRS